MKSAAPEARLQINVAPDYQTLSRQAANFIISALKERPDLLLCASAGSTPTGTYEILSHHAAKQPALFKKMRVLQIDEWGGLAPGDHGSCAADLRQKLLQPLLLNGSRFAGFHTEAANPQSECDRVARWLARHGPIDIAVLGLGTNGHVAMNEPGEAFTPQPHVAKLRPSSRNHPMLKKLKNKPRYGLTLGLGDIFRSRKLLLLVSGSHKRAAMQRLCTPRVTTRFPASFLWLHPNALVLCDQAAAPGPLND
jgi:galactosamine-6-phosphate isomerase